MASDLPESGGVLTLRHLHAEVQLATDLYEAGFLQEAVRKAAERFSNRVAEKAEREDLTGRDLMNQAFSSDKPALVFSEDRITAAERNWHDGYRSLATGLSAGVRNVYTHLDDVSVDEIEALEWLGFISAMHRRLDRAAQYVPPPNDVSAIGEGNTDQEDS